MMLETAKSQAHFPPKWQAREWSWPETVLQERSW